MKILILSDSMSLPRDHECAGDQCWPELVKLSLPDIEFISLAIGKATLPDLYQQYLRYYQYFDVEAIILQCGIVDCAPRALTRFEQSLINLIPFLGRLVRKNLIVLRKFRNIKRTKPRLFRSVFKNIKQIKDVPIISVGIIPPTPNYIKKMPGVSEAINEYNVVLSEAEIFISLQDIPASCIGCDDYHLNGNGHAFLASRLREILKKRFQIAEPESYQ